MARGEISTGWPKTSVGWISDGSTVNPRTDTNVTANLSVTANFAPGFTVSGKVPMKLGMLSLAWTSDWPVASVMTQEKS